MGDPILHPILHPIFAPQKPRNTKVIFALTRMDYAFISYPNLVLLTLDSVAGAHRAGFCVRRMASLSVGGSAAFPSAASSASQKNSRRSTRPCRWKGPERGGPRAPGASPRRPHAVSGPDVSAVQADEECIPNWVDDAGLNRSLMCDDPRSLSVAKVFRTEKWDEYQSTHRYAEMVSSMGRSLVARRIAGPVLTITLVSALVAVLRARFPVVAALTALAPVVNVAGGAVSLLLAFRTNSAFARFSAAADAFAEVLSATRNLSRKMVVWCPLDDREANARLVAAIPWAIKHRGQGIEGTDAARAELENVLGRDGVDRLGRDDLGRVGGNVPMQLMTEITRGLDRMNEHKVELIYQLLMDNDLTALHNYAARTDRLAATPTPPSYARHISRALIFWLLLFTSSVAAAAPALWVLVPGALFVSWLTLGIDDIGMQLEQPFTVLAVAEFCKECQAEVEKEMRESAWTPRIGAPRDDVLSSEFLNSELTAFDRAPRARSAKKEDWESQDARWRGLDVS